MVSAAAAANDKPPSLVVDFDRANKIYMPGEQVGGSISLKNSEQQIQYEKVEIEVESYMDTVSQIRGNLGRPPLKKEQRIYFIQKK